MRLWIAGMTLGAGLLLTGCGNAEQEREIAQLKAENAQSKEAIANLTGQNDQLRQEKTRLDEQLDDAQTDLQALQARLNQRSEAEDEPAPEMDDAEVAALKQKITELEAEIERLKKQAEEAPESVETAEQPTETLEPAEIKRKVEALMPMVKAGDRKSIYEVYELINKGDKQTRDEVIQDLQDWVNQDPDNKHARLALSMALISRFQDLENPMEQGALAAEAKGEIEKAVEIDPDYYDAQHLLALFVAGYPAFTPEFKTADTELDRALEMQQQMIWEDRFAEIYAAYAKWHRVQGQLDDAGAWVQKGLNHAPRDQGLLDENAAVEAARAEQEE